MRIQKKIFYFFLAGFFSLFINSSVQARNIATMMENNRPFFPIPDGLGTALFCEGDAANPCGFVEYTGIAPTIFTPELIDVVFTTRVCEGTNCQCDNVSPCVCENPSCVIAVGTRYIEHVVEELRGLLEDGVPFAATMTEHPVIIGEEACNTSATGKFLAECVNNGGLKLDYRCEAIVLFDENGQLVQFSRSLAGTFLIQNNLP